MCTGGSQRRKVYLQPLVASSGILVRWAAMTDSKRFPIFSNADLQRRTDRGINEMLGMVRGIVCDGVLNEGETHAFRNWLAAQRDFTVNWPGSVLAERIVRTVADGVVSPVERHDLYELYCDTVGVGDISSEVPESRSTRLPFDSPQPVITIPAHVFCFTGAFIFGTRAYCEAVTVLRGGTCRETVVKQPMTLVIGGYGSDAWEFSPYGREIETAMHYREKGAQISIVCEEQWTDAIALAAIVEPTSH